MKKEDGVVVGELAKLGEVQYVSTGVTELDDMLHGWPRGRITELWGNPGVGKSFLLAKTMAALPDKAKCLYIDAEYSLVKDRLEKLGVDTKKVAIVQDGRLEKVTEYILEAVANNTYDLIIIDSLAKLIPMVVEGQEVGENAIGLFARQVKHFEAKLKPRLAHSKTALVVINQARAGFGPMAPAKPQGGFAWEHAIDIRIKLFKGANNQIKKQEKGVQLRTGHWCSATIEKSRVTSPYLSTRFPVNY